MDGLKIALAHEFLTEYGGAEKTFEAIAELYPEAPIYTAKYIPENMPESIRSRNVIAPKTNIVNKAIKYIFTFMMGSVFESMDFSPYDIVISDGNTWNKGILVRPHQMHITYIHTPPRFLYKYTTSGTKRDKWYFKIVFSYIDNIFRLWDYVGAQRPDYILTNSNEVRKRIKRFYNRDATVIYPPVDVNVQVTKKQTITDKPYYIMLGRLTKYKNMEIVIQAFDIPGVDLLIAGKGDYEKQLKAMAKHKGNIKFTGRVSEQDKYSLLKNALGLINPVQEEDFGIVPVEAIAQGTPVLAHRSGGHIETVIEDKTGMLFDTLDPKQLRNIIRQFHTKIQHQVFDKNVMRSFAQKYSKENFQKNFSQFVQEKWEEFKKHNR